MTDEVRFKRIERLLKDLEYECASGLHQNQIAAMIRAERLIGYASLEYPAWRMTFRLEPVSQYEFMRYPAEKQFAGLQLVKGGKD